MKKPITTLTPKTAPPGTRKKGFGRFGRLWLLWLSWVLLLCPAELLAFTITRSSSPIFYIDTSVTPTLQSMYVAYQINNNSGGTYPDLWVTINNFSGGIVSLGPNEDGLVHLGSLAPGQTKTAFFYIQASAATTVPQQHTIHIYVTRPPASELQSQTFSMTVEESIQANANQVETVVAGPNPPQLGGLVTVTARGRSGTLGASGIMAFNPAAYLSWRADAFELVTTTVTLSGRNNGTYVDTLYLTASSSQDTPYTAEYTFRAVGPTQAPTPVSPISFISSGTQIKHTRVDNYISFDPILPPNNRLALGKLATPSEIVSNQPITFSLLVTNLGTYDAILEDFVDTLPAAPGSPTYINGSSLFNGTPIPDPVISGSTLIWIGTFPVPAGATRSLTFRVNLPSITGAYMNTAVAHIGTNQIDTTLLLGDNVPAVAMVTLRIPLVSGYVYRDSNQNLLRDAGEPGTGLTLFAKLVANSAVNGPALHSVAVDPSSGAYAFTNVAPGIYRILIDNNNLLNDITPNLPPGWFGTEMPSQIRTNVPVTSVDLPSQNFGLISGIPISGRVFQDNGIGGGVANDGLPNGGETGLAGVTLRLTDNSGGTVYDTSATDANGLYTLLIPANLPAGLTLKVTEINSSGYLSVAASAGNTGGSYNRAADTITFSLAANSSYTNANFGDVPVNTFAPNSDQTGLPGGIVVHANVFTAGSAGQVSFVLSNQPTPAVTGWVPMLYRDANCNGQLDASDPLLTTPIQVEAGQQVCILVKETIPLTAPFNALDVVRVTASFTYLNISPALGVEHVITDRTTVGNPSVAGLTLVKSADKDTAKPGDVITYTLLYANTSSQPLQNLVLYDSTPAYTRFIRATNGPLAMNLTSVAISAPPVGSVGAIRWTFNGGLAPGSSGSVLFQVEVEH